MTTMFTVKGNEYFMDSHTEVFNDEFAEVRFNEFLSEMEEKTIWKEVPMDTFHFSAVDSPLQMSGGATDSEKNTVMYGTKMFAYANDLPYVGIRDCAMPSITERFGVGCRLYDDSDEKQKAAILNMSAAQNAKRKALVSVVDGKINAVLSANDDKNSYQIFSPVDIFELTKETLEDLEDDTAPTKFEGSWSYDSIFAKWHMPKVQKVGDKEYKTLISLYTSNVGEGSVTYGGDLVRGSTVIPFMTPVRIAHRKRNTGFDLMEADDMLRSAIEDAVKSIPEKMTQSIEKLEELNDTEIMNPVNCMRLISEAVSLPKRITKGIIEEYEATRGNTPATAFVLYETLAQVIDRLPTNDPKRQKQVRGDVMKLLGAHWKKYDVPAEEKATQIGLDFAD